MLNREEIAQLIKEKKLVEGYMDLTTQLTPNGFDLTVQTVYAFDEEGAVDFSNKERHVPHGKEVLPVKANPEDKHGWWHLARGVYKVKTNEVVHIPLDMTASALTRTTLLRMGAFTQHGLWDAGFTGKSEFILIVENPFGMRMKQNARIVQLVFSRMKETAQGYDGVDKNLQ